MAVAGMQQGTGATMARRDTQALQGYRAYRDASDTGGTRIRGAQGVQGHDGHEGQKGVTAVVQMKQRATKGAVIASLLDVATRNLVGSRRRL